jgi:hypothetical protein
VRSRAAPRTAEPWPLHAPRSHGRTRRAVGRCVHPPSSRKAHLDVWSSLHDAIERATTARSVSHIVRRTESIFAASAAVSTARCIRHQQQYIASARHDSPAVSGTRIMCQAGREHTGSVQVSPNARGGRAGDIRQRWRRLDRGGGCCTAGRRHSSSSWLRRRRVLTTAACYGT